MSILQSEYPCLILPVCKTPNYFIESISLKQNSHIAIIDDDPSIAALWSARLKGTNIKPASFSSIESIPYEITASKGLYTLYLVDHDFSGSSKNGINFIKSSGLSNCSILVTNRADEDNLVAQCELAHIKILPKSQINSVPIHFV